MKCGPDGGWHCQPDNGTFELFAHGRRLMPDSGCYVYGGDLAGRKWFRQTRVHQTLTLEGNDSAYAASLLLWQPGDDLDAVVVQNASYPRLMHRRAVLFVRKKFFVLVDDAIGQAAGNVDLHFQFAPGKAVFDREGFLARTGFAKGANVLVQAAPQDGMTLEEEEGQVSFVYEKKEPRPALRFRLAKAAQTAAVRFVTLVAPYQGQEPPKASVRVLGAARPGDSRVELEVNVGEAAARVGFDLTEKKAWLR
jgi:heparan-sulfate lyase